MVLANIYLRVYKYSDIRIVTTPGRDVVDACESERDTVAVLGVLWLRNRFRFLTGYDNVCNRFVTINNKVRDVHAKAQVARQSQRSAAYQKQ